MKSPLLSSLSFPSARPLLATLLTCAGIAVLQPGTLLAGQAGVVAVIRNFAGVIPPGEEGANLPPVTAPFKASDGNFYGIAPIGGTYGNGIVFKLTPAGVYTVLHNFHDDEFSDPLVEEGDQPRVLIEGKDGNLYGVCNDGGLNDDDVNFNGGGTIFKLALNGAFVKLYDFDRGDPDTAAVQPVSFVQGSDGYFYGLTSAGGTGTDVAGTFFRFNATNRAFVQLHGFNSDDTIGVEPQAQLLVAKDGSFYGTTTAGGGTDSSTEGFGTIFRVTTAGTPTLVHGFVPDTDDPSVVTPQPDGNPLLQGIDGALYGESTVGGNEDGDGTIYRCTTAGAFTLMHVFEDGADGANPYGGLVEGADSYFYGGLAGGFGTVSDPAGGYFQIKASEAYTVLSKFNSTSSTNAMLAASGLLEISKGTFYGLTQGGTGGIGTLCKLVVSPVVTSATSASGTTNTAFSYQIVAGDGPTSFNATNLPAGLSVNTTTGLISGKPTAAGSKTATISAKNVAGAGAEYVAITIKAQTAPVITSAKTAMGKAGTALDYQITATETPTSFGATGLPAGLTVSATTGLISGTPTAGATSTVTITAYNAVGKGTETVTLTIANGPPVITSAKTASGKVGTAFSYEITAGGSPTSYGATGLPAGLTVNATTGAIAGTPTTAGTSTVTLAATNSLGKGTATLTLTIAAK